MESRFFEYLIIRNCQFFEPKVVSLGFASVKHCNFYPRFFECSIFRNSRYFELILSSLQKFTFHFSNFENSGTNKNRFKPHTPLNGIKKSRKRCFHAFFYYKASDKYVIEVILKKLQRRCYTIEGLELLYTIKVPFV